MMLEQFANRQDRQFARDTLLPLATAILQFYDYHYKRDARGKIHFEPAASLETWHVAVNPLPEIAGLRYVMGRLLELPADLTTAVERGRWQRMLGELPDLPTKTEKGKTYLLPAETFSNLANAENPELYAVFPYRLFGVGRDGLDLRWKRSVVVASGRTIVAGFKTTSNWLVWVWRPRRGGTWPAALTSVNPAFRFPAMWGPNNDDIPDMDHGGVGQIALQYMLLQPLGDKILFVPRLAKSSGTSSSSSTHPRTPLSRASFGTANWAIEVTPESRAKDVVKLEPQS